ncbi:MAG TPA: hypothetical protein VN830_07585 [Verrucomicrobiae bacterium]|nr:hypothetical protein [Verrucomicrobiae bacterium]
MAATTWVAGLYNEVTVQPAPANRQIPVSLLDLEERRILLPPLPTEAEFFYDELCGYKATEFRAGLQANAEFDARWVLLGRPPAAFDEVDWQRFAGTRFSQATSEAETGLTPIVPGRAWDETDWQRAFAGFAALPAEDEQPERLPYTPPPVPNLGWDDFEWSHDFGARGLAMLVVMDDFVNAPAGGGTGGVAPRGRAARLGFTMPAFR